MNSINIEIKFKNDNKIYYEGDLLSGVVQVTSNSEQKHDGISLTLEGLVNLQLSTKNVGIFEAFYNSVKPIQLLNSTYELAAAGRLHLGLQEFHFEFPLVCKKEPKTLYETYHGVFINITYQLKCDVKRSFLAKSIHKVQQFCIQYKHKMKDPLKPDSSVNFTISPETLQKSVKDRVSIPRFLIKGKINETECCVTQSFTGHLQVQNTEVPIKSIELQLVRVETCGCAEGYSKDATEIQNIQIADGNICQNLDIPIYMILPRLFTCPTLITKNFKIEFEMNLVIVLEDETMITENFPIVLVRSSPEIDLKSNFLRE